MAITINLTNLFTSLGHAVKWINQLDAVETTELSVGKALYDVLNNVGSAAKNQALGLYTGMQSSLIGQKSAMAQVYWQLLQTFIYFPNNYYTNSQTTLADVLRTYMIDNAASIQKNVVSVGSWTANADNVKGPIDFFVFMQRNDSKINSGTDPQQNEFIYAQGLNLKCTADQFTGAVAGNESFQLEGQTQTNDWSVSYGGQGLIGGLTVASGGGGGNILSNGDFESYSATNTPSSWNLDSGTLAGTHIFSDTSNAYRGTYSLKMTLTSTTTRGINQVIATLVQPSTSYLVILKVKSSGAIGTAITLGVSITGTDYTAGSTEVISYGTIGTGWVNKSFFWNSPVRVPTDLTFHITLASASSLGSIFIDEVILVPLTMFRGMGLAAVCKLEAADVYKGDQFSAAIANDYGGVFQTFLARMGFSLPSSGSPTISDSLVT